MSLWHDTPLGDNAPDEFNAIIEIPRNSNNKYEIDKETGLIALDRANHGAAAYPFDYGFAPQTLWDDDDPLDVIVLSTYPLAPGILARVRPVAIMRMIDGGDADDKVIAAPVDDRRWDSVQDLSDLNAHEMKVWQDFFETYKRLKKSNLEEPPSVAVKGFEDAAAARAAVARSIQLYNEKYTKAN